MNYIIVLAIIISHMLGMGIGFFIGLRIWDGGDSVLPLACFGLIIGCEGIIVIFLFALIYEIVSGGILKCLGKEKK